MTNLIKTASISAILQLIATLSFAQIHDGVTVSQKETALSGTPMSIMNSSTNKIDTVRSDKCGFYSFIELAPGVYIMETKMSGYRNTLIMNIIIQE